jgi:DNA repair exonuclease SbcCD nuclease subunit
MIKILYYTDSHIRGTNPRARKDNFSEAMKSKFREIFSLVKEHDCDALVCGGDLFDRPDTAYAVAGEFAAVLSECPVPHYVCPGNHEIYGYNLETIPRTILGFYEQVGLIRILDRKGYKLSKVSGPLGKGKINVLLTGQGFYHDIDRNPLDYQVNKGVFDGYKVHVVHGMLVERPLPYEIAHTLVKDVQTDADVILSGHEHIGYGLKKREDGVWFCNPGALGRVSAKVEEMHRPIQVALFSFSESGITAELIPLKSAQPGTEVLSRDHLVALAEREDRMNSFLSLLAAEGESKFLEVRDIVDDIARRDKLPETVRGEALKRIALAREALGRVS